MGRLTRGTIALAAAAAIATGCAAADPANDPVALPSAEDELEAAASASGSSPAERDTSPWNVCDYAERAAAADDDGTVEAARYVERLTTTCEQVVDGEEPDRPDIVDCYSRTDEPGGLLAGEIATERCDQLADTDDAITVDEVADLERSW